MPRHLPFLAFALFLLPHLYAQQPPQYKIIQHSGYANRYYSLCFGPDGHLWAAGRPNGLRLHSVDGNLNPAGERGLNAEPGNEYYPADIRWDASSKMVGCGNYQNGGFGKGFVFRFDATAFPNKLLWLNKVEGGQVRLAGLLEHAADTSLLAYGISLESGVQQGELLSFHRNTGALRPGFPKRYSAGLGVSLDAAILHQGRLYAAGACSADSTATAFGLICVDAASGEVLWGMRYPVNGSPYMHLAARDLLFSDHDGEALVVVGSGDDAHHPAQGSHIFLQKSRLDGSVLWVKEIDLPDWTDEYAEEVAALPDGYLVLGRSHNAAQQGVFLLKTDFEGKPLWAKRINRGSQTWLPDWPAQAQMLVRNEAVYLSCNAVISGSFGPEVSLIVKLQPDGTLANCSAVEPTPVAEIPFGMFAAVEMPLSASPSPLQAKAISAPVQGDGLSLTSANICQQTGYLCNDRPDLRAQVDSISCSATGGPVAHMRLCNLGKVKPSSGVHVTFYSHNPLAAAATPLQLAFLEEKPDSGQCLQVLVPLLPALLQQAKIYLLVGVKDDVPTPISLGGFPYPEGFAECEYANNLDSFEVKLPSGKVLDLGPDRSICSGDALTLEAPEGFAQYTWQDGSTGRQLVVTEPGVYRVTVADGCGTAQRDSLSVVWAPRPVRQELVLLLPGESIVIAGNTYSSAANFEVVAPSGTGVCDTLVQYKIVVSEDGCKAPKSFLKTFTGSVGKVIVAAKDGYVYILGEEFGGNSLAKFDSAGVLVWARQIIRDLIEPGGFVYPTSMIEDSDGMLTVCGDHSSTSQPIVFRYNPATDHMMWVRRVQSDSGTSFGLAQDILEDGAGGDFLLVIEVDDVLDLFAKGEVFRLSRSTGNLWGTATRYRAAQFRKASVQGQALYVTGSFQDNLDHNNKSGGVVKIDLLSKAPLWAKRMSVLLPNGYEGRDLILDQEGNLISLFSKTNEFILQKSSPDGTLIWQRKYGHVGQANSLANNIRLLDNGDYVLAVAGNYTSHSSIIITRISKDGPVQWGKFVKDIKFFPSTQRQWLDVHGNTTYFTYGGTESNSTLLGRLDASGDVSGACQMVEEATVTYEEVFIPEIANLPKTEERNKIIYYVIPSTPFALQYEVKTRCVRCESTCDTVRVTQTLQFYPGDTIIIGGTAYTQPGTVVQNLSTPAGCDSIVTSILQLVITHLEINCPPDLSVTLPPDKPTTVVDYALPTASTDCSDPAITLRLLQGPPVGGSFPQGQTLVCYEAANACGIRDTCCFSISAEAPSIACDVKSPPGCIRYELLGIRLDALGQRRYQVRLTNSCPSPLAFAYLQLPAGVPAVAPAQAATYTAPGGNAYAVRNPNASPFYSIRYEAVAKNLNDGESDIFEYTLPQQAQPAYIHAAVRLADGSFSETHLSTYACPVLPYQEPANRDGAHQPALPLLGTSLSVWPNPSSGSLHVQAEGWAGQTLVLLQVLNAQGQTVLSQQLWAQGGHLEVSLPAALPNGLYYLRTTEVAGPKPAPGAARFVVER